MIWLIDAINLFKYVKSCTNFLTKFKNDAKIEKQLYMIDSIEIFSLSNSWNKKYSYKD